MDRYRPFRWIGYNNLAYVIGEGLKMCRSIKTLRNFDQQASDTEVREAALQFVRKISGYRHPSQANTATFEKAVDEIAEVSRQLLGSLVNRSPAAAEKRG